MKKNKIIILLSFMTILLSACTYHSHPAKKQMPPGHAKKITGSQSAKPYAPGQKKKL